MHRLLSADWESPDSAVRLNASLTLAELEPSRTLHDARVLLEILGREGEVRATPKGNLPRAVVAEMRERLRPLPDSRDEWYRERKQVNEEDVRAVHLTRILLMLGGLVKRRKGVYSLTRAGSRLAEPERAGELFALLFRTHFRRLNLGYLDGVAPVPSFQRAVAFSLYRFGQVGERWMTPAELKESLVLPPTRRELPPGEHYDSLDTLLESRLLRPLEGFALAEVEVRPAEPGRWTDRHAYRRAGLFDRFLRFELDDPGAGARRG
jgi:hypothetical protein